MIATSTMFVGHLAARGRSFPIKVTGVITTFDRTNQVFRIQVDVPPRLFTIAVGRDCKFIKNGTPTDEQILIKGARVKVSYFATIFTGKIAVKIDSDTARR
jgi:hypothetical protein